MSTGLLPSVRRFSGRSRPPAPPCVGTPRQCGNSRVEGAVWVKLDGGLISHQENLLEFGGSSGIRDRGAIESALARPQNLFVDRRPDRFDLAAAYTAGLSQNHGFVDGNKRTACLTGFVFLAENGYDVVAEQVLSEGRAESRFDLRGI